VSRRASRRAQVAVAILLLWGAGLAALARRELFSGEAARLERAALFVAPGADYYTISDDDRQIGFGSSTIDTAGTTITIADLVVADLGTDSAARRITARSNVELSRTLHLRRFRYELGGDVGPLLTTGTVAGDTLLTLVVRKARKKTGDTVRVRLPGPLLLPTMVPMAIALGERPRVGSRYRYQVFDPLTDSTGTVTVRVRAESLFVIPDSASVDSTTGRWVVAHQDTVRAWRIEQENGSLLTGWIDGQGRMVDATPLPRFHMQRMAYELAFENWAHPAEDPARAAPPATPPPSN
jgi:hypothetical protein